MPTDKTYITKNDLAAWVIAAVLLAYALLMHLVPALFAGLLVYHLIYLLATPIRIKNISHRTSKIIAVVVIALIVVAAIGTAIGVITSFLHAQQGGISPLLVKIADILEHSRADVPAWITENFPHDALELQKQASVWLREHAGEIPILGKEAGHIVAMVLIGMILGIMAAMQEVVADPKHTPFVTSMLARIKFFSSAFGNIVGAQTKIALINAAITWIYLDLFLPFFGVSLPFKATLVVVTFVFGMIPVVGNVISNTAIVLMSLGQSVHLAVVSLVFLIAVHKLEYFLNAKIVGSAIKSKAWELLLAMLLFESAFGLAGVIAAPIYYAFIKAEMIRYKVV